jgi:ABC-type transport system substrate-binding protein
MPAWSKFRRTPVVRLHPRAAAAALALLLAACGPVANAPYPVEWIGSNTLFTSFQERPKFLDPISSYNINETPWTYSIYEPLLRYHYLKRPYQLEGRTAAALPDVVYLDRDGKRLPDDADSARIAVSVYTIRLKPGILFAPHPAFARDASGRYLYQDLSLEQIAHRSTPADFPLPGAATATRELTADDYVYQIKRLASPYVTTPSRLFGLMSEFIEGLQELSDRLTVERNRALAGLSARDQYLTWRDLRQEPLSGARALDDHTLQIRIKGKYPQFRFWLTMSFFSPIPWEADRFYSQRGMRERALTLNLWPVGTGPYMLVEQSATRYVMVRNPNYRGEPYPSEGMPGDREAGLLDDAGKRMPFVDRVVSTLERESEPQTVKFLQGYYDTVEIERYDRVFALQKEMVEGTGRAPMMTERGLVFRTGVDPNSWYMGFNMLDPVVGKGATPEQAARNRKLRQALSIATDWEEWISTFYDEYGAAQTAMGPVPPGLFGHRDGPEGVNPVTHVWVDGRAQRRPLEDARRQLAEAGYPGGREASTGKPLVLYYDVNGVGPRYQARLDWVIKQFAKLGIQLEVRNADYNRFQERMFKGAQQIWFWGWLCDYPDPENFLFLMYGPQARVKTKGENDSNWENAEYDALYRQMKDLPDGPRRQTVIDRMVQITRQEAIWMFGIFPGNTGAYQQWLHNGVPTIIVLDRLQYLRVDPALRMARISQWNRPHAWPLAWLAVALALLAWPAWRIWQRRERRDGRTALVWTATSKAG